MPTAPSPSWNLVRVHGKWHTQGGALLPGRYRVTLPARITNSTDDVIIPAGLFDEGDLQTSVPGSPSLDIQVPANDDPDNEQSGWKVTVEITFTGGATKETYVIDTPVAAGPGPGGGINLRAVALAQQIPQQVALYRVGVPGGLAKLNADGDVVDSGGNVVGAGGGIPAGAAGGDLGGTYPNPTVPGLAGKAANTVTITAGNGLTGGGNLTANRTLAVSYGSTAGTAAQGNDARLSDARTPTAHNHDAANVNTGTLGTARLGSGTADSSKVLYGDGTWKTAPAPGGVTPDASTTVKGIVQLAGDLAGTAAAPTVPGLAGKAASNDARFTDARTPTAHKSTHATGGADVLTPADIGAATSAQGALAGTAVQPAGLTKAAVGLGSVDNTADSAKPVSTAQGTAIGLKVDKTTTVAGKALTGNVTLVPGDVGAATAAQGAKADSALQSYTQTLANAPAGSLFACPVDGSSSSTAGLTRPSARTDIFFIWRRSGGVAPTNAITGDQVLYES